jgi:hypothetical protein
VQTVPTTLKQSEIEQFARDGYVVVRSAFAREDADAMQDDWWRELLELYGIRRDDRSTWHQPLRDLRGAKVSPMQTKIQTPRVRGAISDLLGSDSWNWPKNWGRAIATFPKDVAWDVPTSVWHSDGLYEQHHPRMSAVFAFTFIGAVAPGSGGTLVLSGSPRLLEHWEAELLRGPRRTDGTAQRDWFNRAHPWLAALTGAAPSPADRRAMFMTEGAEIDGIALRVVELTGEPGDMVLCHPTIVHAASPNCGMWPRMMRIGMVQAPRLRKAERPS